MKPYANPQSNWFEEVHAGLTAGQITVPRSELRICQAYDRVREVRALNRGPVYDYLPVTDHGGHLIGMLPTETSPDASGDDLKVIDHMDPLSEADLIGAGMPIVDLIGRTRAKPLLVVSGHEIIGLVAWSDLQKLPVRAALFALVTGFELTMYEAIKRRFEERDDWTEHLSNEMRLCRARREYDKQRKRGSDVDLLLCTQFCDKRDILIAAFDFTIGKEKLEKKFRAIERVRDAVAHATNYAMTLQQAQELRAIIDNLLRLRKQINSFPI